MGGHRSQVLSGSLGPTDQLLSQAIAVQVPDRARGWFIGSDHGGVGTPSESYPSANQSFRMAVRGSNLAGLNPESDLILTSGAFVRRIARNIVIDDARKLRARGGAALALDDLDDASEPWVAPDQKTTVLLKPVIMSLPELYRDVFILSRFTGMSYLEISRKFGVSVKTVEYRMSRALALCQAALRD